MHDFHSEMTRLAIELLDAGKERRYQIITSMTRLLAKTGNMPDYDRAFYMSILEPARRASAHAFAEYAQQN